MIDNILCRDESKSTSSAPPADIFAQYFAKKIDDIRTATVGAPPPAFRANVSDVEFSAFNLLDVNDTVRLIGQSPMKQCASDPIPTLLLKDCADLLAPYITRIINDSLSTGCVPATFKQAYITPLLKKAGLDEGVAANYRPVSNLCVLSKLLQRVVSRQLDGHLSSAGLLLTHQSD